MAAAYVYRNAVVERLMGGYTSGNFSHGGAGVAGSVTIGQGTTASSIEIGTNVPYAGYWEFGHMNVFTRKYERVEHWRLAFEEVQDAMAAAFGAAFARSVNGEVTTPSVRFNFITPPYQGPIPAPGFRLK